MNDPEFEQLAHGAAERTRAEAARIADSRTVLNAVTRDAGRADAADAPAPATDVELDADLGPGWRRPTRLVPTLLAATALVAVAGIVLASRGGDDAAIVVTTEPRPPAPDPTDPPDDLVPDPTTPGTAPATVDPHVAPAPAPTDTQPPATAVQDAGTTEVPDDRGAPLARTVLATYERGSGDGQLGFENCQECEPLRPWAPVVTDDGGIILVADVFNDRWQIFRDDAWTSVPFPPGEVVVAGPVVGPDGYVYAAVADALAPINRRRVVAFDPVTLDIVDTYEVAATQTVYSSVVVDNGTIRFGPSVVRTFDARLGTPTWVVDGEAKAIDVSLSGVRHRFGLPENWFADPGAATPLGDGSVVLHVSASDGEGRGDWLLLRLWADGSFAVGGIGDNSSTTALDGRFSASGFVQLEDAIVEYAYPEFTGPDPLAGWSIPDAVGAGLDVIPRLVPDRLVAGTTSSLRSDGPGDREPPLSFEQTWVRATADGTVDGILQIFTDLGPSPVDAVDADIEIAGRPRAYFVRTADDVTTLRLSSPTRSVTVWSRGLDRDTVADIAKSLRPDADGVGWDVDITAQGPWTLVHEGWTGGIANRRVTQRDEGVAIQLELLMVGGAPGAILTPGALSTDIRLDEVDGRPALVFDDGFRTAITWSPSDDVVVVLGSRGPLEDLVEIARAVTEVDQATWDALPPDVVPFDGCDSMFC